MKIFLAATGPQNEKQRERGMLDIPRRLLSYCLIVQIVKNQFECNDVLQVINKENQCKKSIVKPY